jgi:hypothetical protein
MDHVVYEKTDAKVFYGEQGTQRTMARVLGDHVPNDDYDHDNPDGSMYGRRNYGETVYLSWMPELSPGEYAKALNRSLAAHRVGEHRHDQSDEEDEKEHLRDGRRGARDAAEAQSARDHGEDQEH